MSKMAYISYLVEHGNLKELAEEIGSYRLAKEYIDEHEPTTADEYNNKWLKGKKIGAEPYPKYDEKKKEYIYPNKKKKT
tara:strand:+ start:755 stop:991 length:237 start_codon:yes stop_codon:yes gene_type:complete